MAQNLDSSFYRTLTFPLPNSYLGRFDLQQRRFSSRFTDHTQTDRSSIAAVLHQPVALFWADL